ncbi:MAG: dihydrodipicolinate synthase family protein [Rickettsiales bacterium]|jgi:4-hydroxy-tetrahydrodipicolinate synthase|nr:dihydrodipicolinate synthase family protein [Rickettsiales bacterium]
MDKAITAIVAPMKSGGSVDFESFGRLLDFQIKNGIKTLVVNGSTGEEKMLGSRDKVRLLRMARKKAEIVIAGVGAVLTRDAVLNAKTARICGANYALLTPSEYIKPTADGLLRHFAAVQSVMPTIVYDIKGRTGRQISDEEFVELMKMPNIVGVKAASGDMCQIARVIKMANRSEKFQHKRIFVWSGDDNLTTAVRDAGGDGVISVVSNLAPKDVRILCESDDKDEVAAAAARIAPLIKAAFAENNPAGIKRMLFAAGLIADDRASDEIGRLTIANAALCDEAAKQYMAAR